MSTPSTSALLQGTGLPRFEQVTPDLIRSDIPTLLQQLETAFSDLEQSLSSSLESGAPITWDSVMKPMLVWDSTTQRYDADATPSYGTDTLEQFFERVQFSGDRLLHQVPEPLTHARIKAVAAAKPLPGSALLEPEREDGLMHAVALRLSGSAGSRRCCG